MVSWDSTGSANYVVEYSTDDFENALQITTFGTAVDMYELPTGMYQWRVKADEGEEWAVGNEIESEAGPDDPKAIWSNEDGNSDLFFASANGTWDACYYAQHVGSINDWTGTNECVSANGKGRIQNLFFGSSDSNVLCLTDGENGDAIFVDDAYTELPEEIERNTARLYRIQEIRAGAGDDIVDMTSQRFEYTGEGLTIHGGEGNDTIWASKGKNILFGDAGNDRIVGASDSDIIAGGIGNDRMHGGGGVDVFTFCDNWGNDTVQQLGSGTVTLWFASGSELNWNTETLTYSDGDNSVTVSGVTSVTLKFGDDGSEDYDILFGMGAFFDATTERIFEESGQGILASL
jgi:Ca2+-binding RTX toxin-like protein